MGLFNRKKKASSDINDYYASERRRRVGMAWLLGGLTLIVTLLLALGIFYGGRWAYRTVFDDDQPATVSDQSEDTSDTNNGLLDDLSIDEDDSADEPSEQEADEETQENTDQEIIGSDTEEQGNTDNEEDIPATGPTQLPSTGPSESEL